MKAVLLVPVSLVLPALVWTGVNMLPTPVLGLAAPWAGLLEQGLLIATMVLGYAVLAIPYPRRRLAIAFVYLPVIFVVLVLIGVEISYRMRGDGL